MYKRQALKANTAEVVEKISHLQAEVKALQSENESLKSKAAQSALGDVMDKVVEVNGVKLLAAKVEGVDMNGLRDLGDKLKEQLGEGVVLLAAVNDLSLIHIFQRIGAGKTGSLQIGCSTAALKKRHGIPCLLYTSRL